MAQGILDIAVQSPPHGTVVDKSRNKRGKLCELRNQYTASYPLQSFGESRT